MFWVVRVTEWSASERVAPAGNLPFALALDV
jgi:hypothetical protein